MPSTQTDNLFRLIKSLTKAEKRSFKLYSKRIGIDESALFIQLFNTLDHQREYNEEGVLQKVPKIKRQQLSNLKRHLYRQILTSLRLIYNSRHTDIEIREQIDFARILQAKGHYLQGLKLLDRAKEMATEADLPILRFEIVEFEKEIESLHITKSLENRAQELMDDSDIHLKKILISSQLSNLVLKLYSYFIQFGHAKTKKEMMVIADYFKANLPAVDVDKLSFTEKIYYHKAFAWYNYIQQNFPLHFRYTQKWVDTFNENPEMKIREPSLYLRGLYYLLVALFYTSHFDRHSAVLAELEKFIEQNLNEFDTDTEVQAFTFLFTSKINQHFLEGTFSEGIKLVPELERQLKKYYDYLDDHRRLVFYYKIASLYFGSGDNGKAVGYLNEIINYKTGTLRSDIQCYARILQLLAHFEMKNYTLLEYLGKSVYRFLAKMDDLNNVLLEILRFLRKELRTDPKKLQGAFTHLRNNLVKLQKDPMESRSFLYLDIISWLDSKIQNKPVQTIIREKFQKKKRP
jgi:hypothetical protein